MLALCVGVDVGERCVRQQTKMVIFGSFSLGLGRE